MTYDQLLPVYRQITGLPGQDAPFNQWVQGIINNSGSQQGIEGIPSNYFSTPQGQQYVTSTATVPGSTAGLVTSTGQTPQLPNTPVAPTGTSSGIDFNALTPGTTTAPGLNTPDLPPIGGANYNTAQTAGQTGGYDSVGATTQTQQGTQQQNTAQQQQTAQQQASTGSQASQTGTTGAQQSTGQQTTQGVTQTRSGVETPFDMNALVNSQVAGSTANDATAQGFLRDFVDTGGTGFNSQVDQAVRQSLSGPQMTGAGESAQARAAGYAGANVARNNAGQRLQAADLLMHPSGTASNLGELSPLLTHTGSTTEAGTVGSTNNTTSQQLQNAASSFLNNQNTTGTANTTGSSNTMDFQSLVGNEAQAGTATGQSAQRAGGVAPQGQPVQTGGCVVCTAYVDRNEMHPGAIRRAARYKQANWRRYGTSLTGYLVYGPFLARAVLSSEWFARNFKPFARATLYHEVYLSAPTRLRWRWSAYITHGVFDLLSWPVGALSLMLGRRADVRDSAIKALLVKHNLNFSL